MTVMCQLPSEFLQPINTIYNNVIFCVQWIFSQYSFNSSFNLHSAVFLTPNFLSLAFLKYIKIIEGQIGTW